jgi:DNA polymerase III subunit epsilon
VDRPLLTGILDEPVAFVDVETTGGNNIANRIIEIGVVAACGDECEYEWSTLVNPGMNIPPVIEQFTGITDEMVRHAPFFEDIVDELARRVQGRLFVAHNARFDYGFFRGEFRRAGRKFASRVACTVKLSRRLYPDEPRHNLDAVIERLGLACERRHRALPDAQALWQFWRVLRDTRDRDEVEDALQAITQLKSLPPHLPADLPDRLPEGPGVYRFYGENDALLYVGKARDVRQRVLSHWQGATREDRAQRLAEMVRRIEWDETAGELGALLLEARQVRELQPLYNHALKGAKHVWTIVVADDGAAPRIEPLGEVQLSFEPSDTFGTFKSERAARSALVGLAREHLLCLKVLGLETSAGSCFARQVGRCKGACLGLEPLALHTARVKLALASTRLKPWPFAGPIGIRERSVSGRSELHVVDDWQHLATIDAEMDLEDALERALHRARKPFDLESYRILLRHLGGTRRPRIVELTRATDADSRIESDLA